MSDVEKVVRDFYDNFGWKKFDEKSGEDSLFRRFSRPYYGYHHLVNRRTLKCFSGVTGRLLIAGGGDLPETHTQIAQQFSSVCCLDISKRSLDISKQKLGDKADYVLGSILDIPKPAEYFDAIYCAHVIYHIDKKLQANAIKELLRVIRPGGKVVIIYRNPDSIAASLVQKLFKISLLWRLQNCMPSTEIHVPPIYFYAYPLEWWDQFRDTCDVDTLPWDVMSADQEKRLLINGTRAWCVYRLCAWYEKHFPKHAVKYWSYPIVVLSKAGLAAH